MTDTRNTEKESKLINQGSYGCIYYPSLPFKIKKKHREGDRQDQKRSSYVSKLQKYNFHSEFEDYIGKKIQHIPSFEIFFVPVLSTYNIDLATIKQSYVSDCDAISKYIRRNIRDHKDKSTPHLTVKDYQTLNKKFIIQKMKYINGTYLHRHLLQVVNANTSVDHDSGSDSGGDSGSDSDNDGSDNRSYVSKTLRKDERQIKKYRSEFKTDETERS